MKVYILYETKDADEYGFGTRDDVIGLFAKRVTAEKAELKYTQWAKKFKQDYTYNVVTNGIYDI